MIDSDSDPDAHLYNDLSVGSGEIAARELLLRIGKFVCKKHPELSNEAEEIALEAFERVCERINTFQRNSRFFTWVAGIAVNVVREKIREKERGPLSGEFLQDLVAEYADPEKLLLEKTRHEVNQLLLEEAIETLTEKQRTVFLLKHGGGSKLTSEQMAEQLGMSAGAVRSALTDAHAKIERYLKDKGYEQ